MAKNRVAKGCLALIAIVVLLVACGRGEPDGGVMVVELSADKPEGQAPLPVNFSAAVPDASSAVGYLWDFGNGESAQGSASRTYVFHEAGTFDVRVTASEGEASATDTVRITVSEAPPAPGNTAPVAQLTASAIAGQAPLRVTFNANAIDPDGDELSYAWNFGDGTTAEGSSSQTHRFERAGLFDVAVIVSDGVGGVAQAGVQIAVADPGVVPDPPDPPAPPDEDNRPPTVTLSGSTAQGPAPLLVSLNANASDPDGDPLSYTWNFGDGTSAEGNSSRTVTYDIPGEYTASVVVSDGLAEARSSFSVRVTSGGVPGTPPPEVSISAEPVQGPAPLPVQFSAEASSASGGSLAYLWDFGDGTISGDNPVRHTYRTSGTYTARVTVRDSQGGVNHEEVEVSVREPGTGTPPPSEIPFYGEWAWAARAPSGKLFEGFLSVSRRTPAPDPDSGFAESFVDGGNGAWTHCRNGIDNCPQPTGVGFIDIVDYGSGDQYDIVFVDQTGGVTMVAFDDDDTVGNEVDGAPTLMGGGAWFYEDGSGEDLNFAMVKIGNTPTLEEQSIPLEAASTRLWQTLGRSAD